MFDFIGLYIDTLGIYLLFPFFYFLHHVAQKSMDARLQDLHGSYEYVFAQVSGIRERLVILEQTFKSHDSCESAKYTTIKKAFDEIHEVLVLLTPEHQFKHSL